VFRIDTGSGVPVYRQLLEQVRREVMLGRMHPGDQLPTLKEVVEALAINPNTVAKAYGELEHEGLVVRRQGVGTFIAPSPSAPPLTAPPALLNSLLRWVRRARDAGMSGEQIRTLVEAALDEDAGAKAPSEPAGGVA
jgi:DNA-binding transcriptional regulator YhcF (GntR family)